MSHFSAVPRFKATYPLPFVFSERIQQIPIFYQQPQIQHNDFVTLKTKMADELLSIPINLIEADFEDFLSPDSNTRIIFSGPFGIGKTYFLDKFFKNRTQKYLPIFLRPVNYSLLSNEDVFRLIKYDILFQIIKDRQFIFDEIPDFTKMEFAQFFASQNLFLPLVNLLKILPKIKTLVTGTEEIEKLIKKYSDGLKQINKNEQLSILSEFRTEAETNFLLEYDQVSQLIADQLDEIAEKDSLQKVLIIDDLDRLDPEHIFRLFNVFSAHFDHVNYYPNEEEIKDNKFGFDKIIFVCDIENIRKIFAHKYGLDVDFSGYIDKFYTDRIYRFLHRDIFERFIYQNIRSGASRFFRLGVNFDYTFRAIFQLLFDGNQFNIRDLRRLNDLHFSAIFSKKDEFHNNEIHLNKMNAPANSLMENYPICIILNVLIHHFGSVAILKQKLKNAFISTKSEDEEFGYNNTHKEILPMLILFADFHNHKFVRSGAFDFRYENLAYRIAGDFEKLRSQHLMWFRVDLKEHTNINKGLFFKILTESSVNILDSGILTV